MVEPIIHAIEQKSSEWFALRKGRITGSRIGSIIGSGKPPLEQSVMRNMVREHFDQPDEFRGNKHTRWGEANEAFARRRHEIDIGASIEEVGFVSHKEYDWLGVSPDGVNWELGLGAEYKCPSSKLIRPITEIYKAQCQLVIECCELEALDFVRYIPPYIDDDGGIYVEQYQRQRISRDSNWFTTVLPKLQVFMTEFNRIINDEAFYSLFLDTRADGQHASDITDLGSNDDWADMVGRASIHKNRIRELEKQIKVIKSDFQPLEDELKSFAIQYGGKVSGCGVSVTPVKGRKKIDYDTLLKDLNAEEGLTEKYTSFGKQTYRLNWR